MAEADRVSDAFRQVQLRSHAREPTAPDDGKVRIALAHAPSDLGAVCDLVAEDARTREQQGSVAGLDQAFLVVVVHHRVDEHDLVALLIGERGDLQQLQRGQIRADAHTLRRIGAVRQEQDDSLLALDHEVLGGGRGAICLVAR